MAQRHFIEQSALGNQRFTLDVFWITALRKCIDELINKLAAALPKLCRVLNGSAGRE